MYAIFFKNKGSGTKAAGSRPIIDCAGISTVDRKLIYVNSARKNTSGIYKNLYLIKNKSFSINIVFYNKRHFFNSVYSREDTCPRVRIFIFRPGCTNITLTLSET